MGETDEVDDAIEQLNQITDEIKVKYIDELENTDNEKEEIGRASCRERV